MEASRGLQMVRVLRNRCQEYARRLGIGVKVFIIHEKTVALDVSKSTEEEYYSTDESENPQAQPNAVENDARSLQGHDQAIG